MDRTRQNTVQVRSRRALTRALGSVRRRSARAAARLPQQAQLDARARPGQTEVALRGEPLATAVEVRMGQGEGIGRVLAALAFQDPEQQRRQIRARLAGRAGLARQGPQLAAHLAARDLVPQQGVVAIEQLVTDGGEKVEMARQIGDASLAAGGDRLGPRRT